MKRNMRGEETKDAHERRVLSVAPVAFKDGVTTFSVGIAIGEDHVANHEIREGDEYKLLAALTKKRVLMPGDEVMMPGVNGSETEYGVVLKQDENRRVAWEARDAGVRISERSRLVRISPASGGEEKQ